MLDEKMRLVKDSLFQPMALPVRSLPPWLFSVLGLLVGVAAALALWQHAYPLGLFLWFLNRVFDGLDGAVARMSDVQSDFGGYIDIVIDFVIYAIIPVGLVAGQSSTANIASLIFLLCVYYVNAASWMYLAAILEMRGLRQGDRLTTITMPAGIIGGTETIVFYTLFILFPLYLSWLFGLMGLLLIVTILQRLVWAARQLS